VDTFGWETLAEQVNINCFRSNPTVKSSLKFLRKTQWARDKVESLYVYAIIRGKPLKPQFNTVSRAPTELSASTKSTPSATNSHIWKTPS